MNFLKCTRDPLKLIKQFWPEMYWPGVETNHITYDPNMKKGDYSIVRECGHDGTLIFTSEMFQKGLNGIVNQQSYYKPTEPDWNKVIGINYVIGPMRHVIVFGMLKLGISKTRLYPGQRERIRIPVKCTYVMKG